MPGELWHIYVLLDYEERTRMIFLNYAEIEPLPQKRKKTMQQYEKYLGYEEMLIEWEKKWDWKW